MFEWRNKLYTRLIRTGEEKQVYPQAIALSMFHDSSIYAASIFHIGLPPTWPFIIYRGVTEESHALWVITLKLQQYVTPTSLLKVAHLSSILQHEMNQIKTSCLHSISQVPLGLLSRPVPGCTCIIMLFFPTLLIKYHSWFTRIFRSMS